jgi:hypothetical protein
MSSFLYYSIQSGLTENEIISIDRQVANNREAAYLFIRKLPSNSRGKAKRFFVYGMFIFQLGQPLVPCADAVVMSLPPAIHRLSPMEQDKILSNKNSYPQIALIIQSEMDKMVLTDQQSEDLNLLCYKLENGSITLDKVVLELQGGGFYDWATLAFIIYMLNLQQGNSFQNVLLPHMDPTGWASGKYDSKNAENPQCRSNLPSRFEREALHTMKQMCSASVDENDFVMRYNEALKLVIDTYGGSTQITEDCKVTDWQIAKKAYHFHKGFNMDLDNYDNFDKQDLVNLQNTNGGLITYVQKGGRLPPIKFINEAKKQLTDFCLLEKTEVIKDAQHYGQHSGVTPGIMYHNDETGRIAIFNKTSGDLITTEKYKPKPFNKFVEGCYLGNRPKT